MSTGALVLVWGHPVHGREQHALEVLAEALDYYRRLQRAGEVESFEPVALEPSGGDLAGMLIVRGDPERLARVRASDEFVRLSNRTLHVAEHFGVHTGFLGEAMQRVYADWGAQARELATASAAVAPAAVAPAAVAPAAATMASAYRPD